MNILRDLTEYYKGCPLVIQMSWILTGIFLSVISMLIIYLKYLRFRLRRNKKIEATLQAKYERYLISYLYAEEEPGKISAEQKKIIGLFQLIIKNHRKRKIVISTFLKLKIEISGEMADSIDKLYIHSGLFNYTLANLRSNNWQQITKGIRELTQFNIRKAYNVIKGNMNHPKQEVRKEMHHYLVTLFHFKGLDFVNTLETTLSEWDQIQLLEIIKNINTHETFEITPWLRSTNDSVVVFALKMAKIYNLFEIQDELMKLIDHPNEKIRVQTINMLNHFHIIDAKEVLKNSYSELGQEEQTAFFKMLENIHDNTDETVLFNNVNNENFEIKVLARKILRELSLEKFSFFQHQTAKTINYNVICSQ